MSVDVVVPWAGGCPHRERAWAWVASRYAECHPSWRVVRAEGGFPWRKGAVVSAAVEASTADTIVCADADVWTDGLAEAVTHVNGGAPWAMPHDRVLRLTEDATSRYINGDIAAPAFTQEPYTGIFGGGVVVAPRDVLRAVPIDPRFVGWGQEDVAWGWSLEALMGPCWRGTADLVHLFHPPQARMNRIYGSPEGARLMRRYGKARHDPVKLRSLIEEGRLDACAAVESDGHDHPQDRVRAA